MAGCPNSRAAALQGLGGMSEGVCGKGSLDHAQSRGYPYNRKGTRRLGSRHPHPWAGWAV